MGDGNWGAWRDMVLREIGRQNSHLERLETQNTDVLVELGKLKLVAGMCGAVAGTAACVVATIILR